MILVDTSIWVDHLRAGDEALVGLLETGAVLAHPSVIGELALGSMKVAEHLHRIERTDVTGLLQRVVERELSDALEATEAMRDSHLRRWRERWDGVRAWFVRTGSAPSRS